MLCVLDSACEHLFQRHVPCRTDALFLYLCSLMGSGDGGEEPSLINLIILINNLTSTESVTTGSCSSVVSMTTLVRSTFSGFVPVLHSYVVVLPFFKTCFKIGRLSFTGALQDLKQKIIRSQQFCNHFFCWNLFEQKSKLNDHSSIIQTTLTL
jgi:hypothetical protein